MPRTPERAPEPPAPERPRRNLFEFFGRRKTPEAKPEAKPKAAEAGSERKAEKAVEQGPVKPDQPKKLGERLLAMVGVKPEKGEATPAQPEVEVTVNTQESQEPEAEAPKPAMERLVDSARKLGGNVLRIIGGARETVETADATEPGVEPTDTKPLDRAERKVERALDELDEATETAYDNGGGGDGERMVELPLSQLRAMQEVAAAAAYRDVELQLEAEQERRNNKLLQRQVGNLALGALLVAGVTAAYSWSKVRHLRKEQVAAQKREVKQQEALHESEARIAQLEHAQQGHPMDRRERQAYVTEVSHYASAQAEQIREVAADVREQQHERNFLHVPPELKVEVKTVATPERKKTIVERASELVGSQARRAGNAVEGGVVSAGGVVDFISGKIIQPLKDVIQPQPKPKIAKPPVHDPVQTWLNGVLLILGILLIFAILLAVW